VLNWPVTGAKKPDEAVDLSSLAVVTGSLDLISVLVIYQDKERIGFVFLALSAFLPSVISSILPKIRERAPRASPLDPPLTQRVSFFAQLIVIVN